MAEKDIVINFSSGLNTKSDPFQVPIGQFLDLQNSVFQKGGLLQKRPGYPLLTQSSEKSATTINTLNGNLISIGNTLQSYSPPFDSWTNVGDFQPCSLSVQSLIRNNVNQIQNDCAIANGLICLVYTSSNGLTTGLNTNYYYAIFNENSGQIVVPPTALPVLTNGTISGSSRVFVVGTYFVIVSQVVISSSTYLQYFSISSTSPNTVSAAQNTYSEIYVPLSSNPGWDAIVTNSTLVIAYNTTIGGQGIHITTLTQSQIQHNQSSSLIHAFTNAAYKANILSVCCDFSTNPNIIYISFWNGTNTNSYTCAVYLGFGTITTQFTPQLVYATATLNNITSAALNGKCTVLAEIVNTYSYASTVKNNYIVAVVISNAGAIISSAVMIRSLGLASKGFIYNDNIYFLAAYDNPQQDTYFLINATITSLNNPIISAKLAWQKGGGYLELGLPSVTVKDGLAKISYLFKQNVQALNTLSDTEQVSVNGIYSQLGINLVSFNIQASAQQITTVELANVLHISGGYLAMFDGQQVCEHNFFLFPDSIVCSYTESTAVTPTGSFASGSNSIVVSSATGIYPGMTISDSTNPTYIPSGTTVVYVNGTTITISQLTTHVGSGDTLSIQSNIVAKPDAATNTAAYSYIVTYEWTDAQGNHYISYPSQAVQVTTSGSGSTGLIVIYIPTLRITAKLKNPLKICVYRWSIATQVYNEVTSIFSPLLNDNTVDSVYFVDTQPDANIVGNSILYTTGGVVPNFNAPASTQIVTFDTRLCLISSEDEDTIYFGKIIVDQAPVDMSPNFSYFVAPNQGVLSDGGNLETFFPMDDKLILWKKSSIFYINGTGPNDLGTTYAGSPLGAYSRPYFITSVVGCTNSASIVLYSDGVAFQSDKGIWALRRDLTTTYLGAPVEAFNASQVLTSEVIQGTTYIIFGLDTGQMLMYDYYFGQWGTFVGINAIDGCIYQGTHVVLDKSGDLLRQTPGTYSDLSGPVLMKFSTSWLNLASLQGYERFYEFYFLATYYSPHLLNISVAYDYLPSAFHQSIVSPKNFSPSVPSPFGIITPVGSPGALYQWRVHAKQQLCQSFQLNFQEVYDPTLGVPPGAGFSMSGITLKVALEKATRPIRGANTIG